MSAENVEPVEASDWLFVCRVRSEDRLRLLAGTYPVSGRLQLVAQPSGEYGLRLLGGAE